ncbi:MAG: adenosine deaminase [Rhizobiaceae bacterium]|nr:adenosine deaminase [Rhizobiaceae bacterium]
MVIKAELHCHIEGAAHPELVLKQAQKYNVDVSKIISADNEYIWHDFTSFLGAYDLSASLFRSPEDYHDLANDVFLRMAKQDCIYGEIFASPDHAARIGCTYIELISAIASGIETAKSSSGIEGRIIVVGVRHEGIESVEQAARDVAKYPHKLVTGFGIAGDERIGDHKDFAKAFAIAKEAGLGLTGHAGELCGAQSVRDAIDHWGITRIGHGVRAIEDSGLVERIAAEGIVLEACPGSNISLEVFPDFKSHPFRALDEAGCKMTLNSDDPPYFHTSLEREYEIAREYFGYNDEELLGFTITAIEAAFVDGETRKRLLEKCTH